MTIGERLKKLRKSLNLTQQEFSDRLKVSRSNIATYEVGKNNPADAVINLICREFNVSEEWLRTGVGKMFVERSRADELSVFIDQLLKSEPDDIRRRFVTAISRLNTVELEALEKTALLLSDEANNAPVVGAKSETTAQSEPDLAAKVAALERQNEEKDKQLQELAAEIAALNPEPDEEEDEYDPELEAEVAEFRRQCRLEKSTGTSGASTPASAG